MYQMVLTIPLVKNHADILSGVALAAGGELLYCTDNEAFFRGYERAMRHVLWVVASRADCILEGVSVDPVPELEAASSSALPWP